MSQNSEQKGIKGIHLLSGMECNDNSVTAEYQGKRILDLPVDKIKNTSIYNQNEIEIDIPFEQFNENHDNLCEIRFFFPQVDNQSDADVKKEKFTDPVEIHNLIRSKAKVDENIGDLIVTLPDLPLVVPRGKYQADIYKNHLKLHGSTFNYRIMYKNVVKAFLLPDANGVRFSYPNILDSQQSGHWI